jgi:hypothetical protein
MDSISQSIGRSVGQGRRPLVSQAVGKSVT